ncbi:F0F1 ATP synthase subunit delta [Candidatus Roizmanbacteria bacterium]|nr:F0F1 ATP synthase subunit delta [Candidatus Roizmanbacteria bacterium]
MKIDAETKLEIKKFLQEKIEEEKRKVIVRSAYPLTKEEMELIFTLLPFLTKNDLATVVDRTLIAGVIIHYGSKVLDLSVKGRLVNLKGDLYEAY